MIHHCPMCGEQWDEDRCVTCGWREGAHAPRTTTGPRRQPTKGQRIRRAPARLEKFEQADGVKLLKALGAAVYVLGTHRRAGDYQGAMVTPGQPDVHCFLLESRCQSPRHLPWNRRLLFWEVKRARGARLSPEQAAYRQHCEDAGVDYVCGDLSALMRWLVDAGYLRRDQVPVERLREEGATT